ncbi:MAG: thermonuclease family protein [Chloroflexota bacterium]
MFQYQATVVRIVDGDTAYLDVDLGFFIRMTINVRFNGINTPEIRGPSRPAGLKSKAYVEQAIPVGSTVVVETYKAEKYGRYLADIHYLPGSTDRDEIRAKGRLLNQELVEKGLAVEYYP